MNGAHEWLPSTWFINGKTCYNLYKQSHSNCLWYVHTVHTSTAYFPFAYPICRSWSAIYSNCWLNNVYIILWIVMQMSTKYAARTHQTHTFTVFVYIWTFRKLEIGVAFYLFLLLLIAKQTSFRLTIYGKYEFTSLPLSVVSLSRPCRSCSLNLSSAAVPLILVEHLREKHTR